jgi:DNA-binding SARP family transcriptional activator
LYVTATIHIDRFEFDTATSELDQVEAIATEQQNEIRLSEILVQRARIYLFSGHYLAAIAQAEKLLDSSYNRDNARGRCLRILGVAYLRLGKVDDAMEVLESALGLSRQYGDKLALSNLLQDLQLVYMRMGRFDKAAACLQEVVAIRRSLASPTLLTHALNDLGYHYHQQGDYVQAFAAFQEGLNVIAPFQNRRIESYLLWSLGDLQRDLGSFAEAMQLYNRALSFAGNREPSLRCSILISISILHRWEQRFDDAVLFAEEAFTIAEAHKLDLEQTLAQVCICAARASQENGMHGSTALQASHQLASLVEKLIQQHAHAEAAQTLAICTSNALARDKRRNADTHLTTAIQLLKNKGNLQPFIAEIVHNPELDQYVAAHIVKFKPLEERLTDLRDSQLRKNVVIQLDDRINTEFVYNLRIQTLGKEKVERDGVPVLPGEWRATAARELFFYLLFLGPHRREAISLDFWPESPTERVRSNFHTTLYRLRQALGENVVVYVNEEYSINRDVDIWCDAHEFDKLVGRAQNLSLRDARTEDLFRRAVDLYQGDFLPLLDAEWISSYRERLHETYLESVIGLGYCAEVRADYRQALNLFKQALKLDYFREDVHRAVMSCYKHLGERQKIYAHLKQMQDVFRRELAIEPTQETIAWAKRLLS